MGVCMHVSAHGVVPVCRHRIAKKRDMNLPMFASNGHATVLKACAVLTHFYPPAAQAQATSSAEHVQRHS
eukprot:363570-Chlamydomonas_euryale.AAC.2